MHTSSPLLFIINLGDIIDGHVGEDAEERDEKELQEVLDVFATLDIPKYPVLSFSVYLYIYSF